MIITHGATWIGHYQHSLMHLTQCDEPSELTSGQQQAASGTFNFSGVLKKQKEIKEDHL